MPWPFTTPQNYGTTQHPPTSKMEHLIKMQVPGDSRTFSRTSRGETYVWGDEGWLLVFNVAPEIEKLLDIQILPGLEKLALQRQRANESLIRCEEKQLRDFLAKAREASKFHGGVWMEMDASQSVDKTEQLVRVAAFWETWVESMERSKSKNGKSESSIASRLYGSRS